METIGTILKKRIKEQGYSQIEFAEACQISITSLKKYMTDQLPFSIDLLKRFAELLDCTTDYLLGQSETPKRNIQSLKELTHLSDSALLFLEMCNSDFCTQEGLIKKSAEEDLIVASLILEDPELMLLLKRWIFFNEDDEFFGSSNGFSNTVELGGVPFRKEDMRGALYAMIQEQLCRVKDKFKAMRNPSSILTREATKGVKKNTEKWLKQSKK